MQLYTSFFSNLPHIETDRLVLRPLQMSDARDMYEYARDPEVSRYVLWDAHKSIWETKRFLHFARSQYRRGFPGSFAVNPDYKSAEVGYSLGREWWNKGLMTEALDATLRFGFEELKLNRIEAQHDTQNPASGRVMAHCGMRFEGVMRQRIMNKGTFRDVAVYAILKNDWQLIH